ncbi:MAG: DUF2520 domain-containing protein [Carboxylicivirga sp.]|jgi:predicted short-subunit dehydrogenase-like oxidoreductase (DUF2520 family)|nr:DUF2520 domain-containing protein [Carboxylicivirga sp.]
MDIVIIGSGNVATHLSQALFAQKHVIKQVYSRSLANANDLAQKVGAEPINNFKELLSDADLYIISVKDDAIQYVVKSMPDLKGIVTHTAGSIGLEVLDKFSNSGVFYPFQTFTKHSDVDFSQVPVLIESDNKAHTTLLMDLARQISEHVIEASSKQRGDLHIAAVFACNFVNHMYRLAEETLNDSGLSFELLKPLIAETANKVKQLSPSQTQTGPASRNDQQIISKHINALLDKPEHHEVYQLLTNSILKRI